MLKTSTKFICQQCGYEALKWEGKCGQCGQWNTLVETAVSTRTKNSKLKTQNHNLKPLKLSEIKSKSFVRIKTSIGELDRVLGGGIVPGSVVLVAGEPGIGKSTLLTQLALNIVSGSSLAPREFTNHPQLITYNQVLYVCGEESPQQIKLRIDRLLPQVKNREKGREKHEKQQNYRENMLFLPETNIENILSAIGNQQSAIGLMIVDSIQTLWTENLTGTAGSVGQVRECSNILLTLAKKTNIPIFLIGHITKEGNIAGPKVLEHLVDTVLYIEGDREHDFRILRASKNRFGRTDEVGIFTMTDKGMEEIENPSQIFLTQNSKLKIQNSGSALTVAMQGIRPIIVEIQALVVPSNLAMPRRVAVGIGYQKLQVLCAVIQKKLGLPLYQSDVFINVAGGLKINEPAVDLAVVMAIISSFKNKPLPYKSICLGEVGLLGEIRKVGFWDKRIKEAKKLGFKTIIGEKEFDLRQTMKYLK